MPSSPNKAQQSPSIGELSTLRYNTKNLTSRVSSDLLSAFCASTLVAPLICLIDQSIIIRTHSTDSISKIFTTHLTAAAKRPWVFLTSRPYLLVHTLYFSTYAAANGADTVVSTLYNEPASKVTPGTSKFLLTSTTNISVCLYKDAQFAKLFGKGAGKAADAAVKRIVPKSSLALFAVRDSMTILASFNLPHYLAPMLGSQYAAQFLTPAAMQLFSTPLHLLGLDLFNRPKGPKAPPLAERWRMVRRDWLGASFARMGRIIPAYGVGGVVNTNIRKHFMTGLE